MGNFGNSFSRELGKNTGKVASNLIFGDKWSTPKRVSATVKAAEIKASESKIKAEALLEKARLQKHAAELEYELEIDKIKLEQEFAKMKDEEAQLQEIVKMSFNSNSDDIFQNLNELFSIIRAKNSETYYQISVEKIKLGIFKLEQIGAIKEAEFFKETLIKHEEENIFKQKLATEEEEKNKMNRKKKFNMKLIILGISIILCSVLWFTDHGLIAFALGIYGIAGSLIFIISEYFDIKL
jgi:hypothetical protein